MPTSDPEKLREKWRRNKATQRARQQGQPVSQNSGDWQDRLGDAFS